MGLSTTTVLPVAVGNTNVTQLMEPTMEEDSGLVAGIVIGVVTVVLILAAAVSLTFVCVGVMPLPLYCVRPPPCMQHPTYDRTNCHCSSYCEAVWTFCLYFNILSKSHITPTDTSH
jgi:hypothetical protein